MNLYTVCNSCRNEIKVKSSAATRSELQMEKGDEFTINCNSCGTLEKKHVNDIKAQPNNTIILIGVVLGIIASVVLWIGFNGAIGTVMIVIPFLFWQQQKSATKTFNHYMVKRK